MKRNLKRIVVVLLLLVFSIQNFVYVSADASQSGGSGKITREYWSNISGTSVSNLTSNSKYPNQPTGKDELTLFEAPTNWADNYGTKISGFVHPPATGNYKFAIAGDDNCELWLSTDENPANKKKIAWVSVWTNPREWTKETGQKSASIALTAGKKYYIEALHKEGGGGDNLAVAWEGPGVSFDVIQGMYLSPNNAGVTTNLAVNKTATQSSTDWEGVAGRAVDEKTDGSWSNNSVTHTKTESQPWWQVDLAAMSKIDSIKLWNRTDCCSDRLKHYTVSILDASGKVVWSVHKEVVDGYPNPSIEFSTGGVVGRYVKVQLADIGTLSLAEVEVFGVESTIPNIAVNKIATQSSTYTTASASRAVDGLTDGKYFNGSVTHTTNQAQPWWQVDLATTYKIDSIKLWNRTDCCSERLKHYTVSVLDASGKVIWSVHKEVVDGYPNPSIEFTTGGVTGRYVKVQLADTGTLSLAEVEVFGVLSTAPTPTPKPTLTPTPTPSLDITSNMVAHFKLDETTGTTAYNATGTNNGVLTNFESNKWTQGPVGGAVRFDGINDWIDLTNGSFLETAFTEHTYSLWIKAESTIGIQDILEEGATGNGMILRLNGTTLQGAVRDNGIYHTVSYSNMDNNWHHVSLVFDGAEKTLKLYVDGNLADTFSGINFQNGEVSAHGDNPGMGAKNGGDAFGATEAAFYKGFIDDVRIYDRALNIEEIGMLKALGSVPDITSNMVAHFKLDETSGTTAYNATGTNNGVLTNYESNKWTQGPVGGALRFDGINDWIDLTNGNFLETAFTEHTYSLWIKAESTIGIQDILEEGATGNGMTLRLNGTTLQGAVRDNGIYHTVSYSNMDNNWHHVSLLFDGAEKTLKLYVDGNLADTFSGINFQNGEVSAHGDNPGMGAKNGGDAFGATEAAFYKGFIDDVRIYDRALNIAEIGELKALGNIPTDTQAPTVPTNLTASNIAQTSLTLSWSASTDNVGVTGYDIYKGTEKIGSTTGATTYLVNNLLPDTSYAFSVRAKDAKGNISASSVSKTVTTSMYFEDYVFDEIGRLISVTMENGDKIIITYDANGNVTTYKYNGRGFLETVSTNVKLQGKSATVTKAYFYDDAGRKTGEVQPKFYDASKDMFGQNVITIFNYDNMDRLVSEVFRDKTGSYVTKANVYDNRGNLVKTVDAKSYAEADGDLQLAKGTTYKYNDAGLLIEELDPQNSADGLAYTAKYVYDGLGRKTLEFRKYGVKGQIKESKTLYVYNDTNNIVQTYVYPNSTSSTRYRLEHKTFDLTGNVIRTFDARNKVTSYQYNPMGKLRKITYPAYSGAKKNVESFSYDVFGNLKSKYDSAGNREVYFYNNRNQMVRKFSYKVRDAYRVNTYTYYDKNGNKAKERDGNGKFTYYGYDELNRLVSTRIVVTNTGGRKSTHISEMVYDLNGNVEKTREKIVSSGVTKIKDVYQSYDTQNRLVIQKDAYGKVIERLVYDKNGQQVESYDADNNKTTFEYDLNNRLIKT